MVTAILLALASVVGQLPPAATPTPPPPRVAFLGDSLTLGLHASAPSRTYRELLLNRLGVSTPRDSVATVIVDPFGLTDDALARVPAVIESNPTLIFLEVGNHEAFAGGAEIDNFEQRYDELLYNLQATGATVIAGTLAWLNYPAESREFRDAMRLNATIRRLAAARGIAVADLWTATAFRYDFVSSPEAASAYQPFLGDDLHPNDAGHAALATAFWDAYQRDRARRALVAVGP